MVDQTHNVFSASRGCLYKYSVLEQLLPRNMKNKIYLVSIKYPTNYQILIFGIHPNIELFGKYIWFYWIFNYIRLQP